MNCVIPWHRDKECDDLWWRVPDVNADRSNQYFSRFRAGSEQGCQFKSIRLDEVLLDTCNLPNYETENHLRQMYMLNTKDNLNYHYRFLCKKSDYDRSNPIKLSYCGPLYLRQRTKE